MTFQPQSANGNYPDMRTRSLMATTQLPNVQLDLACETEATLTVPWTSPVPYWNLLNGKYGLGVVKIMPYARLKFGTGVNHADVTVWGHFTDIELVTPTLAQSGGIKSVKKGKSISETEAMYNADKPLSSSLTLASKAASYLSAVPSLSAFMAPAAWVTAALSGAASSFGWSKPINSVASHRMTQVSAPYMNNVDCTDNSLNLGFSQAN